MPYSAKYLSDEMSLDEIGLDEMSWIPSLETCLQMFSRVEVDVYPRVGSFKHIAEAESSNAYVSAHGSLVLQPFMFQWIMSYRFLFIYLIKLRWNYSFYI